MGAILVEGRDHCTAVFETAASLTPKAADVVELRQAIALRPGIVDIGVKVSEPGERHKESFRSAGRAAAAGVSQQLSPAPIRCLR